MTRVHDFPNRAVVEEEAGVWLIRLDADDPLSPVEIDALRQWLERSPVHREALSSLIRFYGKMNILTELAVPLGSAEPASSAAAPRRKPVRHRMATAAVLLVAVTLAAVTAWFAGDPLLATNGLYATSVGHQRTTTLADGSTVALNTNSRVEAEYDAHYRNVRLLQGEAYFTVANGTDRPFRVYAGSGRIEAVGTAFAVRLKEDDVSVTVTEGKVALAALRTSRLEPPDDDSTGGGADGEGEAYSESIGTLAAGQGTTIAPTHLDDAGTSPGPTPIRTLHPQELERLLSWRNGLLVFSGEPLAQVVEEISRYTTTTIVIDDPDVRSISIGGQFRVGDTEALWDALESNFELRVTRIGDDHVRLTSGSGSSE